MSGTRLSSINVPLVAGLVWLRAATQIACDGRKLQKLHRCECRACETRSRRSENAPPAVHYTSRSTALDADTTPDTVAICAVQLKPRANAKTRRSTSGCARGGRSWRRRCGSTERRRQCRRRGSSGRTASRPGRSGCRSRASTGCTYRRRRGAATRRRWRSSFRGRRTSTAGARAASASSGSRPARRTPPTARS